MDDAQFWDERFGSRDQLFSGSPNGALVAEVTGVPPGQALDVGCGEGADALWLASRGWRVTAVDISRVALERARAHAADAFPQVAPHVAWVRADLSVTPPPTGAFDLVSIQYFPLAYQPDHRTARGLLASVAPGGTLLFVGHEPSDPPPGDERGVDPGRYYQPAQIVELLDDTWTVQVREVRPRTTPTPADTPHSHDTVLRAQRSR
ncbi:class I SAM-dependent methyltransferase [Halostreptopolyspora alba]|uniref:Class I SAM-dependent methyltransferase n=1 Tax=Halostreptopolyspora alba TaxID=2487137 RepID=A0A3N0EGQ0_9ACTN|nr:class I SAM-dependent methyltransferase [Nocardiopsaceae bacterium YIM 96095]